LLTKKDLLEVQSFYVKAFQVKCTKKYKFYFWN